MKTLRIMAGALLLTTSAWTTGAAPTDERIVIENDVRIPMRDGTVLMANVYRPRGAETAPAILTLGPYGKDRLPWRPEGEDGDVNVSKLCAFETPDPGWWVPHGYAVVRIDARGLGKSPGRAGVFPKKERQDFYDAIAWAGTREWSNGNVGLLGISYYAVNQWHVAAEQPPHLKAIIPWEGFVDPYRDAAYHGGIPSDAFIKHWFKERIIGNTHKGTTGVEPFDKDAMANDLDGPYWASKSADLTRVTAPVYAVASWGAHGLHLRGTIDGFLQAASEQKWLRIHGNIKLEDYYAPDNQVIQKRFFDCFLKEQDNGFQDEPRVRYSLRLGNGESEWRETDEWPLANTTWKKSYLDANTMTLRSEPPSEAGSVMYAARKPLFRSRGAVFLSEAATGRTEIVGPMVARLWVSSSVDDMDLFVALRVLDERGKPLKFVGEDTMNAPAAQGWLRVSHRKTDAGLSQPHRPRHTHDEKQPLKPGEIVPVDVEIWPTSVVLRKGYRLQVEIRPHDPKGIGDIRHLSPVGRGNNTIYTGGNRASYLMLPVLEEK